MDLVKIVDWSVPLSFSLQSDSSSCDELVSVILSIDFSNPTRGGSNNPDSHSFPTSSHLLHDRNTYFSF